MPTHSAHRTRWRWLPLIAAAALVPAAIAIAALPSSAASGSVVAKDGSGNYTTVQAAINAVSTSNGSTYTISIKAGVYRETITVPSNKAFITLKGIGSAAKDVVIVNNHSAGTKKSDGSTYGTFNSATAFVNGHDFTASNLTISNDFNEASDSGSNHQAVALNITAARSVLDNVRLLGNQDTLLVNKGARTYVRKSYVEGDVDFIFGGGIAVFDRDEIHTLSRGSSSNNGAVTAASTPGSQTYGFLFYQCNLTSNAPAKSVYLGRPWHPGGDTTVNPQVVFRNSTLGAHNPTHPWTDMSGFSWKTARFFEYQNTGAGSGTNSNRPQLTSSQAANDTPQKYLAGSDGWNPIY
jgi:pectinesterase